MNRDFWKGLLVGLFIGAAIALISTGFYMWAVIGGIPLVGGAIKGIIKKKAKKAIGIKPPPPNKGFQYRR